MSNRRRLPGTRSGPPCASCGHRIGPGHDRVALNGGRFGCARCRDAGRLLLRLPCGCAGQPGTPMVYDSADASNLQCPDCTPHPVTYLLGPR